MKFYVTWLLDINVVGLLLLSKPKILSQRPPDLQLCLSGTALSKRVANVHIFQLSNRQAAVACERK